MSLVLEFSVAMSRWFPIGKIAMPPAILRRADMANGLVALLQIQCEHIIGGITKTLGGGVSLLPMLVETVAHKRGCKTLPLTRR